MSDIILVKDLYIYNNFDISDNKFKTKKFFNELKKNKKVLSYLSRNRIREYHHVLFINSMVATFDYKNEKYIFELFQYLTNNYISRYLRVPIWDIINKLRVNKIEHYYYP